MNTNVEQTFISIAQILHSGNKSTSNPSNPKQERFKPKLTKKLEEPTGEGAPVKKGCC